MTLYVLRHAIAVPRNTPEYEDDSKRPLTRQGEKKMRRAAKGMRSLGLTFDLILSSPFERASRTAAIVAGRFRGEENLLFSTHLQPDGDPAALIKEVLTHASLDSVLLVGHEPYLGRLVSMLLSGVPEACIRLKKGGLCCLTLDTLQYGKCASLDWLLTPKQLRRL